MREFIPVKVLAVLDILHKSGYSAYLVGGCVRDVLMNREPKDWDITTNANPDQIQALYPKTVYENDFGTVFVINEEEPCESAFREIQITPYRTEGGYSDARHPDSVSFNATLQDDLSRRDFTINAIAFDPILNDVVDPFGGIKDIKDMSIRTVGNPNERFQEDALRLMRCVRFHVQLGFNVSRETFEALKSNYSLLSKVSCERIRDEFNKIISSPNPMQGINVLRETQLLQYISKDLMDSYGIGQNRSHIYDVYEHLVRACQFAADNGWEFHVRLAALFHDIGKPPTKRFDAAQKEHTFYGHEVVGARITERFMRNMKYDNDIINKVVKLIRYHMFFSDTDQITLSAVRRIIRNVSPELIWDLMKVRRCDRIGMGRAKEDPYRLRKYEAMIEEALRDPISVSQLKIDGNTIMKTFDVKPGPRIGWTLNALMEEVLEDPQKNTQEFLVKRATELLDLSDAELKKLGEAGKEKQKELEEAEVAALHAKHKVRKGN